ncbi:metallopeptidase TldD-related protein, partial [Verrucomicrobiota bacterium]
IMFAGYGRSWRDLNEFYDPGEFAERTITDLRNAERTVRAPAGKSKAFFPPEMLATFLYPVIIGVNGRNVAKGDSPLGGRLNHSVLAPCFTIVDEPHMDFAPGSSAIDDCGIPTQRHVVFDRGVLRMFLYDLDSAGLAGTEPTGNRSCSPYNLVVTPGDRPSADLMSEVEDGVFLRSLSGFHTCNHHSGDFACDVALGYRIEKGEITGRIKNTMVAGNIYEMLAGNVELSSDLDYQGRFPHAVMEGMSVSSSA